MPNTKQTKKRMKTDEERRLRNKSMKSNMRSAVKRVLQADSPEAARAALPAAMKQVDKCNKKNIIHENAAARKKTQLSRKAQG